VTGRACLIAGTGLALLLGAACGGDTSYAVITVRSASGEFTRVEQLQVLLTNEPDRRDTLYYPPSPGRAFRLSPTDTTDFSVSFSGDYRGVLKVGVAPRDNDGPLGYGETEQAIDPGGVVRMEVAVMRDVPLPMTATTSATTTRAPGP
jgi:hypothetical protein